MEKLKHIAIHSVPRSGSTWLGSIFDSHPKVIYKMQPLFSYAFKDRLSPESSLEEIDLFFSELEFSKDDFLDQVDGKNRGIIPSFSKNKATAIVYKEVRYHYIIENLLQKDESIKIIGLVRNPLSVISSWLKAPKEFKEELGWKIEEEWRYAARKNLKKPEEFNGYEKWKEVTELFISFKNKYPEQFYMLQYENLLADPKAEVENLFSFCNLEVTSQTLDFLLKSISSNNTDAYSVFKSKKTDDQWKKELPQFIIDEIKEDEDFKQLNKVFKWI